MGWRWSKSLLLLVCFLVCLPDTASSGAFGWWRWGKRGKEDRKGTVQTSERHSPVSASGRGQRSTAKKMTVLRKEGGRVSWSRKADVIAFDRAGRDGYFDIYTMRSDGSYLQCLTCGKSGVPQKHAGNPSWPPSGRYILFQAQSPNKQGLSNHKLARFITSPGVGVHNDLWLMRPPV